MPKKNFCSIGDSKIPADVLNLIIRKLKQLWREHERRLLDLKQIAHSKADRQKQEHIKEGRWGAALNTVPVFEYNENVTNVVIMTKEWPRIVWETIVSVLEKAHSTLPSGKQLNAIVDEYAWKTGQKPFTLCYIDPKLFKESVRRAASRYGQAVPPSFDRALSLAVSAGLCGINNTARQERNRIGIAIDEYVIAQRQSVGLSGASEENIFRREGTMWKICYDRETTYLNLSKGLIYISYLLGSPFREYHVSQLVKAYGNPEQEYLFFSSGEISSKETIDNYRKRYSEICRELEESRNTGDHLLRNELLKEKEALKKEILQAVGMDGKLKKHSDETSRQAKAVSAAITRSLNKIKKHHPCLYQHLINAIKRGEYLSYTPDTEDISWITIL